MRYTNLYSSINLIECEIFGPAWFTGTRTASSILSGNFRCADTTFHERAWFSGVEFNGPCYFDRTKFTGRTTFSGSVFTATVSMVDASFACNLALRNAEFRFAADLGTITYEYEPDHRGFDGQLGRREDTPGRVEIRVNRTDLHP